MPRSVVALHRDDGGGPPTTLALHRYTHGRMRPGEHGGHGTVADRPLQSQHYSPVERQGRATAGRPHGAHQPFRRPGDGLASSWILDSRRLHLGLPGEAGAVPL